MSKPYFSHKRTHPYLWLVQAIAVHSGDSCLMWPFSKNKKGYGQLCLPKPDDGRPQQAHRVAFKIAHGRWPHPMGLHKCNSPSCVNPRHIFEGTALQNSQQMISEGRCQIGTARFNAKLDPKSVQQIRAEFKRRVVTQAQLAARFGVTRTTIEAVTIGRSWKHVA